MSRPEAVPQVQAASLDVYPSVADKMQRAESRDYRLAAEFASDAARLAVAAWALAVEGHGGPLAAISSPDVAHWLMHPDADRWQVAACARVTKIEIWDFEADAEPPRLRVGFDFAGHRRSPDPDWIADPAEGETSFVGFLDLTLTDSDSQPWQLSSGHVEILDKFLGYTFTSRREAPGEYRQRTGSLAADAAIGPTGRFALRASFAEHDERFSASAAIEVQRETVPSHDEAAQLVWPAVHDETTRALGEGDWRPALSSLDVVELLGELSG